MNNQSLKALGLLAGCVTAKTVTRSHTFEASFDKVFFNAGPGVFIKSLDTKVIISTYDDLTWE